jgi:protein-tyrosine phosphatase
VEDSRPLEPRRELDVPSGENFRDLGGYDTPMGPTNYRRFVRSGTTAYLTQVDLARLEDYGVCRVLDLRSSFEDPRVSDRFSKRVGVEWLNVPLFDYDLSDPKLSGTATPDGNYLIDGYVTMISNKPAIRQIFEFFASTPPGGGVLFHCAAGMDRTGMTAMLLLGLAEVPRKQIVADYLYSFAPIAEVDRVVFDDEPPTVRPGSWNPLPSRKQTVEFMLDRIEEGYGTTRAYLAACGISEVCLEAVRGMLVGSDGATNEGADEREALKSSGRDDGS